MKQKISVVILAKNEQDTIAEVVLSAARFADQIVVIDGNSSDETVERAAMHGAEVVFDNGKGKGAGVKKGILVAKYDIIVFMDADGSHEPNDIPRIVEPIINDRADLVVGSRVFGGSDEFNINFDSFLRQFGANCAVWVVNHRWRVKLTDIENGYRAVRKKVVESLQLTSNDFVIDQEMVMKALKRGYRIVEIPSHEYRRKGGKAKLRTLMGWKFLLRLLIDIW